MCLPSQSAFTNETIYSEFDVERIETERRRMTTFVVEDDHRWAEFDLEVKDTTLSRYVNPAPFVPADKTDRDRRCDEILMIQAMGLKKEIRAYQLQDSSYRYFRRTRLHTGTACHGKSI